uniref:Uncharacterized protein n=1 Tax=Cannabis sativa TaxID=3483 RepID=A0A803QH05_CANSA
MLFFFILHPKWVRLGVWPWSATGVFDFLSEELSQEIFESVMMMMLWLWCDRNSMLFGGAQSRIDVVPKLAKNQLMEFHDHHQCGLLMDCFPSVLTVCQTVQ